MNWYSIFYWLTVADSAKHFFDVASNTFTTFAVISLIGFIVCGVGSVAMISVNNNRTTEDDKVDPDTRAWMRAKKIFQGVMYVSLTLSLISWMGFVFVPDKKDALIIISGGTVGNFIMHDSSTRQIPSEAMTLLRDKIREEIKDIHVKDIVSPNVDTLKGKSKDELIEIIKKSK